MIRRTSDSALLADIGLQLREARRRAGMTQTQLAMALSPPMNQSHLSEVERGLMNVTLDTLVSLAEATGCMVDIQIKPKPTRRRA